MAKIAIVFHSGYGHTERQAQAVHDGAASASGAEVTVFPIDSDGNLPDGTFETLAAADAIIFGSPTYMGGPSWQFKRFAEASSKPWTMQAWKDKIGGGFTNSASMNGDKFNTILYFFTLAMQHSMVWIGLGILPANRKDSTRGDLNWLGAFGGALAQSPADASPAESPHEGDLATARALGHRIAEYAVRTRG